MKTVKEISELCGVSIKTLHYYDKINLLKPKEVTEAGYRLYGDEEVMTLQKILLYKELEFSLKEIKNILLDESNRDKIIDEQIELLKMKREYFNNLITFAQKIKRGEKIMTEQFFNKSEMNEFAKRAKEKWGTSETYAQYENNIKNKNSTEINFLFTDLMDIFKKFNLILDKEPSSEEAKVLVEELQSYISENLYDCTLPILKSLGEMYRTDEFRKNIDSYAGEGVAHFVSQAIQYYKK